MKNSLLFATILLGLSFTLYSQDRGIAIDAPAVRSDFNQLSNEEKQRVIENELIQIKQFKNSAKASGTVYRVPVVFHVMSSNGSNQSNISDCIIQNQIDILNAAFRNEAGTDYYNNHVDGADTEIEFFLACVDPSGNPTNGINRVISAASASYTTVNSTSQINAIKAHKWDTDKYLNIWTLETMPNSNRVRGQGWYGAGSNVGVFVHYSYVGSVLSGCPNIGYIDATGWNAYDRGATVVHEVGHYLNLRHTFENCSPGDYCDDTPAISGLPNPYCGSNNETKGLCSGATRRLYEDYMDYTDDACMNMFTVDQKNRMRTALTTWYSSVVSQTNVDALTCSGPTGIRSEEESSRIEIYPNPNNGVFNIRLTEKALLSIHDINGKIVYSKNHLKAEMVNISSLPKGVYTIQVLTEASIVTEKLIIQ